MFQDTLALRTNPFGPSFPSSPENRERLAFLTDLDRKPLRLDQCAALLGPLFCPQILDLEDHKERFRDLMRERNYVFEGKGERSPDSALVLIRGAIGSGKTTLGAWMISEIARLPGDQLRSIHVAEPAEDSDGARIAALDRLGEEIVKVPKGEHIAALIENVTGASMAAAIARFNELSNWPRLFVLTTSNLKLLDADERTMGGTARIEVFTLRQITPADADKYVMHRLPQYRDPQRQEISALSEVFPFREGFAGRVIQSGADKGEAPIVLRQLNTHFRRELTQHAKRLRERPDYVPVHSASSELLADYLLPEV